MNKQIGVFFFVYLLFTSYSSAQPGGILTGLVKDVKTGEPLIGAAVQLEGSQLGGIADINGFYEIRNIPPQTYNVTASFVGYRSLTQYNVVIRSGGIPDLNFHLEEAVNVLEGVVAVASPFDKPVETPMSVQKLSIEEITAYPGGNNDIAKVVQSLPGISGSAAGFRNDVIIRGGAPNENVYYLDGIEIPNINHFATQGSAGGPAGMLNVSFFENVEVASGSFGAQYDNVLSGVLQFDQREGNHRHFQTNLRVGASEAAITAEGPLFKPAEQEESNSSFIASVRRSYLQLLFKALDLPFLPDYWDYQYKVSHKLDNYNTLIWTGIGSIDRTTINVPDDYSPEQQAILEQIPVMGQWTSTSGLIWRRRSKDYSGNMSASLSGNLLNNNFRRYRDNVNLADPYFDNNSREQEIRMKWQAQKFIGDWTFSGGALLLNADYTNQTTDAVRDFNYDARINFWRYGLFGQASVLFNEKLSISGGFRLDGNNFMAGGSRMWRTFSPRLSMSWRPEVEGLWALNASAGRYYKIPPYTILGFTDSRGTFVNKETKYIRSDHLSAGFERLLSRSARITVEGFYKKYDDYPVSTTDRVSLANLGGDFEVLGNEPVVSEGAGRSYGLEFLFQQKFAKNFYGILAYTWYKSEFTSLDSKKYLPSVWDNRHLLSFTGGYKLPKNWEIGLRHRFLGRAPYAAVDEEATLASYPAIIKNYSDLGSRRLNAYNQADIRVDKRWNMTGFTLEAYLEVQNFLGSDIPSSPQYGLLRDETGQIIEPRSLAIIEGIDNSRILPTIGIVANF